MHRITGPPTTLTLSMAVAATKAEQTTINSQSPNQRRTPRSTAS